MEKTYKDGDVVVARMRSAVWREGEVVGGIAGPEWMATVIGDRLVWPIGLRGMTEHVGRCEIALREYRRSVTLHDDFSSDVHRHAALIRAAGLPEILMIGKQIDRDSEKISAATGTLAYRINSEEPTDRPVMHFLRVATALAEHVAAHPEAVAICSAGLMCTIDMGEGRLDTCWDGCLIDADGNPIPAPLTPAARAMEAEAPAEQTAGNQS